MHQAVWKINSFLERKVNNSVPSLHLPSPPIRIFTSTHSLILTFPKHWFWDFLSKDLEFSALWSTLVNHVIHIFKIHGREQFLGYYCFNKAISDIEEHIFVSVTSDHSKENKQANIKKPQIQTKQIRCVWFQLKCQRTYQNGNAC